MRRCSIPGCRREHYARGWCNPHYQRWRTLGDPLALKRAELPTLRSEVPPLALAWAAGLFDGEGSINLRFSRSRRRSRASDAAAWVLTVRVLMTHEATVRRMAELFGGSVAHQPRPPHRDAWYWDVSMPRSEAVLRALYPHLVTKREQARIAIDAMTFRRETPLIPGPHGGHTFPPEADTRLWEFKRELNALSHKGPTPMREEDSPGRAGGRQGVAIESEDNKGDGGA